MKSKERHELHQNELAAWLTDFAKRVRPYIWHIVGGIVIVILVVLLINMQRDSGRRESVAGYQAMVSALTPTEEERQMRPAERIDLRLAAVDQFLESRHGKGPYASNVLLAKANLLYERAIIGWANREDAARLTPGLEEARNIFRDIRQQSNVALHPQAAYGQACSVRLLGKLQNEDPELLQLGKDLLAAVVTDFPASTMAEAASARLKTITDHRPLTLGQSQMDLFESLRQTPPQQETPESPESPESPETPETQPPAPPAETTEPAEPAQPAEPAVQP